MNKKILLTLCLTAGLIGNGINLAKADVECKSENIISNDTDAFKYCTKICGDEDHWADKWTSERDVTSKATISSSCICKGDACPVKK
jgi:hypothetical protein